MNLRNILYEYLIQTWKQKLIGKFPDPLYADYPINVISIYDTLTSNIIVWLYNKDIDMKFPEQYEKEIEQEIKEKYDSTVNRIIFCPFDKEHKMLENFLTYWENNYPDVVTGWNINKFDIMYIINRIIKVMPRRRSIQTISSIEIYQ